MNQYYKVLGVKKGASDKEIKSAWRKLSKKYHPDINSDESAVKKMSEINDAYEILSGKRKPEPEPTPFSGGSRGFRDQNPFGFSRRKGQALQFIVDVTLEEIFKGTSKEITFRRNVTCGTCDGQGGKDPKVCPQCSGQGMYKDPLNTMGPNTMIMCHTCGGSGQVLTQVCSPCSGSGNLTESNTVTVKIPKGVTRGSIVMSGIGNKVSNGITGDVIFRINLKPHKVFEVDGYNLHKNETINVIDLMLGTVVEFETLDGKVKMNIPKLCDPHQVYRLRGKGLVDDRTGIRGDIYVNLITKMPETLSEEQEEVLRKLKNETITVD